MFSKEAIQQMQQAAAITAAVQAVDSAMDTTSTRTT